MSVGRADRWLTAPVPATRLAGLRILVGAYATVFLLVRFPNFWSSAALPRRQFEPVGVLAWTDSPWPVGFVRVVLVLAVPVGVAFTVGWRFSVTGPAFAVLFLVLATYRLSWGHVIHTEHLPALHLLALGWSAGAAAWSLDQRAGRTSGDPGAGLVPNPVQLMVLVTLVSYVLAGIAKIRNGGHDWLVGDVLRNQVAFDNLRKELLGSWHSPIGGWAVRYDWLFPPMAVATVVVEMGAPVALLGGRWRTGWAVAAWGFHAGIAVLMWISFPYPLLFLAYAPLFPVERWFGRAGAMVSRQRRPAPAP